jgi:hypothetical protein
MFARSIGSRVRNSLETPMLIALKHCTVVYVVEVSIPQLCTIIFIYSTSSHTKLIEAEGSPFSSLLFALS